MSADRLRLDPNQNDDVETWLRRPFGIKDLKKAITYADDMEPELRKEFLFHYITLFSNEYVNEKEKAHYTKHNMPFKSCPTTPASKKKHVFSNAPVVMDDISTPILRRRASGQFPRTPLRTDLEYGYGSSALEFSIPDPTYPEEKMEREEKKPDEDTQEMEMERVLSPQETQENRIGLLEEMYKVLEELPGIEEYLKLFFNILRTTQLPIETLAEKTVDFLTDISYCPEDDKFEGNLAGTEDYETNVIPMQAQNEAQTPEREQEVSPSPYLADTPTAEDYYTLFESGATSKTQQLEQGVANINHLKDLQSGLDLIQGAYKNILKDLAVRHKAAANVAANAQKLANEMLSRNNEWREEEPKVDELESIKNCADIQRPFQCDDDSS